MLQSFVPLFCMTFFICLFIVLMQFLWRYIDELVGKGLSIDVVGELFFYAALSMVPMALPLAILLASLMTFGNLGEHFELTAMKAAGVSLMKTMRPLTAFIVLIAVGAFFFQNDVLPLAQTKMWTLLFSVRQKTPEVEIPEGVFYDQIPGYNIFVKGKDKQTGTLYDMMIYDVSKGFDNAMVILADSGHMSFTEDKTHLYLHLWQGESFENLRDASESGGAGTQLKNVPYRRESFSEKELTVPFDVNFNRLDEEGMRNQYVGKNIEELQATIDSIGERVDSVGNDFATGLRERKIMGISYYTYRIDPQLRRTVKEKARDVVVVTPDNVDSIFRRGTATYNLSYLSSALSSARRQRQEAEYKSVGVQEDIKNMRRHAIEMQKKFTLSFACIIFFFIGAPLGAIIRKGGLGLPIVISVALFIFYYIIDNTGFKMAKDGRLEVWEGMWLSSAILLPLGIFLTYKAVNDSAVFNSDSYANLFRRLLGRKSKREVEYREVVMVDVEAPTAIDLLSKTRAMAETYLAENPKRQSFIDYWRKGYNRRGLKEVALQLEETVEYLSNSKDKKVVRLLTGYPVLRSLWLYHPTDYPWLGLVIVVILPVSIPLWIAGLRAQHHLREEMGLIVTISQRITDIIEEQNTPKS